MSVPDPREELERKAVEAIDHLVSLYRQERIDGLALSTAAQAIYTTISGLVDWSVVRMIQKLLEEKTAPTLERRVFASDKTVIVLNRAVGSERYTLTKHIGGKFVGRTDKTFEECDQPFTACAEAINLVAATLRGKSMVEL